MTKPPSNSQIAKLGDRLRDGVYGVEDLVMLSEYRASFAPALAEVVAGIRSIGKAEPTERPEKSLKSIIYKLQRLSTTKLDQIRDIAGCRIVVAETFEQHIYTLQMPVLFPGCRILDLRNSPHSGYRAVHIEVRILGRRVEVQVRTELQDMWAQCSEQWALATEDVAIKYGGGPPALQKMLIGFSEIVSEYEQNLTECYLDMFGGKITPTPALFHRLQQLLETGVKLRSSLLKIKRDAASLIVPEAP